jgi:anti-sigma regulatory factor (Ser/Thr protein kinase)
MVPERSNFDFLRSYPGHASFAPQVRRDLGSFAERAGFDARDVDDITLAIGELLVFTLRPVVGPVLPFRVGAWSYPDRIEIEIEAVRAGFARSTPVCDVDGEPAAPRGFGMQIIRRLVTQVTFGDGGTKVRIVKRRSSGGSAA